jgi:hypothetical protein
MLSKFDKMCSRKPNFNESTYHGGGVSKDFDPDKILYKINNYKKPQTPNFNLMTSRPMDDDVLPSYMKVSKYY